MNKEKYLKNQEVNRFISWVAVRLDSDDFRHSWVNRRNNTTWECSNIYDAFKRYHWQMNVVLPNNDVCRGDTFAENKKALDAMSTGLRGAVLHGDLDDDALVWSLAVMRWGGVFPSNGAWLVKNRVGLAKYLRDSVHLFAGDGADTANLRNILRFNSGMTKIYSLLADDFIIYDSRVAAALGWMVVRYCQEQGLVEVPAYLSFPWAPAKEAKNSAKPKNRNPTQAELKFPRLYSGYAHAEANLRANWVLSEILVQSSSKFLKEESPLRALEAALFMIGYDLTGEHLYNYDVEGGRETKWDDEAREEFGAWCDGDFTRTTHGGKKSVRFFYHIDKGSLIIRNEKDAVHTFSFDEIYKIATYLYRRFNKSWFPLANNVTKMKGWLDKGENIGLGCAILAQNLGGNAHAQAASYLGVVLEDMGLFEWNEKTHGIQWRLLTDVPPYDRFCELLSQQQD